jgi:thiamine pyrophosphate-dependent acetolactate synthase large subunit-like protein
MMCDPDSAVPQLLQAAAPRAARPLPVVGPDIAEREQKVTIRGVGAGLRAALGTSDFCITRLPLGWHGAYLHFRHPLDYIGPDGGAGVGAGPGITVGAALAVKGSGRLPIGLIGDGDFIMGNTAVWTAVHYGIPCLMIIMNNRSYFNDERHQEHMAVERGRPAENRWIGQHIGDPDLDLAAMARAQGAEGYGPITDAAQVQPTIEKGIAAVRAGKVCVIDMRVEPGYDGE